MDLVLELADHYALDAVYPVEWPRDDLVRQSLSISAITLVGGYLLYFSGSGLSYYLVFDKQLMKHPRFLENQVRLEIAQSVQSIPVMTLLMLPWFLAEVRGYAKTYTDWGDYGSAYTVWSVVWFLLFTDMLIYWFHRWLHHPLLYAPLHKPHHKWIVTTPFASHAFHPVDGYIQALPYHIFVMCFPIHRTLFLALFLAVNYWTISIHDGLHIADNWWVNGAAHHAVHHEKFVYNYGQYLTLWDRLGGSFHQPPVAAAAAGSASSKKQA